jgi:signal transduction histidine kinase
LRRIATLVAEGATAGELFSAVAREVSVVLDVPVVTVGRYELDGDSPVSVVLASLEHASFPVGSRWPLDGAGTREIYEDPRPIRIEDFSGLDGTLAAAARQVGMSWVVGAPIIVNGLAWGNIYAGTAGDEPIPDDAESGLVDFSALVSIAIANSDAREKVGRLLEEQAALRRVATLVAAGTSADELFTLVADEVRRLFDAEVAVGRFEPDESAVVVVGLAADDPPIVLGMRLELDDSLVATTVRRTGRPARREGRRVVDGAESTVAAPIIVEGKPWGVIAVNDLNRMLPPDTEEHVLQFTELVATAIANMESRSELAASEARARELAHEQAALRRVATRVARGVSTDELFSMVAEEVAGVMDIPVVAIHRYEADATFTTLGVAGETKLSVGARCEVKDGGIAGMILATGRPSRKEDFTGRLGDAVREDLRLPMVGVPIVVEGNTWGFMVAAAAKPGTLIPKGAEERLARFTELLATAIANAKSRADVAASEARARELANEQAALRRVATLVAQGASPDELFSAVAKEVADVLDIPTVGIRRYEADGTFTILGNAGDTPYEVGTRWPVNEGLTGTVLATGRSARKDGITRMLSSSDEAAWEDVCRSTVSVPIVVDGGIWGFIMAAADVSGPLPADAEERLARFTELVATAVSNATTRSELVASRARVVSAADETRRRLERDLHDGIQQWLVALALRARKAAALAGESDTAAGELSDLADDLVAVTDELREISRGIHPAILSDSGLDDALNALARRSAIRVDLDVSFKGRYDPVLEATVYYVAAESLTNAVKHAQASLVTVRGGRQNGEIELEIKDDGVGGADPHRGTGLIGLKDRVDTLGGTISFSSRAGAGTTIRVTLPLRPRDPESAPRSRSDETASSPASG